MSTLGTLPRQVLVNSAGTPYGSARLYAYQAGTLTPQPIYTTEALIVAHPLPYLSADSTGLFPAWYLDPNAAADYRYIFKTSADVLIYDEDNVPRSPIPKTTGGFGAIAAEIASSSVVVDATHEVGDFLRYGLVPNVSSDAVAKSNTAILTLLLDPTVTGITGRVYSPNTTGADVYYFNDIVPVRDGCRLDLCGTTWNFNKAAPTGNESNSGFLMCIRDVTIENGSVIVNFSSGTKGNGNGIFLGARGIDGTHFIPAYDSLMARPMGNIALRNLYVQTNCPAARCIEAFGGLQDVIFDNVWVDGQSVADGFYYEFGWATNEAALASRQTSHAHNLSFRNFKATNLLSTGTAIAANGAYNVSIDGLYVAVAGSACAFSYGESYYYRPWSGVDGSNSTKRTVTIRNVVAKALASVGITIQGSATSSVAGGYLSTFINALGTPSKYQVLTDLVSATIDGFALNGTTANYGIAVTGAERVSISNGRLIGFARGISMTNETTHYSIRGVHVLNSTGIGIYAGSGFPVWSPARFSIGEIVGCFIAGSGAQGIIVDQCYSCDIRDNRFGYETNHDGVAETTQLQAVLVNANGNSVVCSNNYVAGVASGVAYALASAGSSSRGCKFANASGITTYSGIWENVLAGVMSADNGDTNNSFQARRDNVVQRFDTTITTARTQTLNTANAVAGDEFHIVRTGLGAFVINVNDQAGPTLIKQLPVSVASAMKAKFDGTNWKLLDYGLL